MKIIYKTADIFTSDEFVVIHGCNKQGAMGSGFAKTVREQFPEAYHAYKKAFDTRGLAMAEIVWAVSNGKLFGNAITQEFTGRDGRRYVSYDAISNVFKNVNKAMPEQNITTVGMPLIGAGLGGGSWRVISAIIETEMKDVQPVVYLLDGIVPES